MNWELVFDVLSWISLIVGGFFLFVGSLGMVRLRDFWARVHAASIIDSAGVGLIILGMMFQTGLTLITVKFFLIIIFLLITGPTASHAVVNAAFASGSRPTNLVSDATQRSAKQGKAKQGKSSKKRGSS